MTAPQTPAPTPTTPRRGVVERVGLLVLAASLLLALLSGLLRRFNVGRQWDVRGMTIHYSWPLASALMVTAVVAFIVGLIVLLVGKAGHR